MLKEILNMIQLGSTIFIFVMIYMQINIIIDNFNSMQLEIEQLKIELSEIKNTNQIKEK
jgi:hypothetical protein